MAASRASETPEQTSSRLGDQRTRQAVARAAENPEQRQQRREEDRTRRSTSRAARWKFMKGKRFTIIQQKIMTVILNFILDG